MTIGAIYSLTGQISFTDGSQIPVKSVAIMKVMTGSETFVREITSANVPAP